MPAIESVIFDWAGTLTPWHRLEPADAWLAAVGAGESAARLKAAEEEIWIRCRDEHRSGTLAEVADARRGRTDEAQWDAYFAWWDEHTITDPRSSPCSRPWPSGASRSGCCPTPSGRERGTRRSSAATACST